MTDRFLRLPTVIAETGLTKATIYRYVAAGTFPAQVKIGPAISAWRQSDIDAWKANPIGWKSAA